MSEEDLNTYKKYVSNLDITKYIVLDSKSNYWYSAEYVDEMLKKQDKEIERLKEENNNLKFTPKTRFKDVIELREENKRLNNLLKETSQTLSEQTTKAITLKSENERLNNIIKDINKILKDDDFSHIEKLQEIYKLVGSDKE